VASVGRRTGSRRLGHLGGACLLAVVTVAVAGCVGMPQSGQVRTFSNKQADTEQNPESEIGLFPSGPQPNSPPKAIVNEFLLASASYPTDAPIVQEYLADPAKDWKPGWAVTVLKNYIVTSRGMVRTTGPHGGERAVVGVSGPVLATLTGTGQYVLASAQGGNSTQTYQFDLVKVGGQWRILNPPPTYRLVTETEFPQAYQSQDLYFFPSASTQNFFAATGAKSSMLVPDPVFVPTGTSPAPLVTQLVTALRGGPSTTWLQGAANTAFPPGTKILGVLLSGATVTVDLGGTAASADTQTLERISAELLWTLAGPTASVQTIQSVELERDGQAWSPPSAPCATGQAQTAFQVLASYECYDPYPSVPASFSYVGAGQPWSRCGSESEAQDGSIGAVVSVFGRTGSASKEQCGGYVDPQPFTPLPHAPQTPALSMAAVSPNGHFVAGVSPPPDQSTLYVGPAAYGTAGAFATSERLKNDPGITAISWDRDNYLWVAQNDNIWVVPGNGTTKTQVVNPFGGAQVTSLAVAPDGVRIAAIVQTDSGAELELAAIERAGGPQVGVQRGSFGPQFTIEPAVQLGPNVLDPVSLTWYNADTLIVLDAASGGNTLMEVPVDGEQATALPVTPSGVISITADNTANVLVVGLSNDKLEFSASIAGPWEAVGNGGGSPVYP
jgi:lipoprotein LpqB-like beta-propeller protein/sporulation and spore germination protein